jgi:hypothetical protein
MLVMRPHGAEQKQPTQAVEAHRKLATVDVGERRNVDYAAIDRRL